MLGWALRVSLSISYLFVLYFTTCTIPTKFTIHSTRTNFSYIARFLDLRFYIKMFLHHIHYSSVLRYNFGMLMYRM